MRCTAACILLTKPVRCVQALQCGGQGVQCGGQGVQFVTTAGASCGVVRYEPRQQPLAYTVSCTGSAITVNIRSVTAISSRQDN